MNTNESQITEKEQDLLFEDDYLIREVGPIAQKWDIALTELVANAWDAGAFNVKIKIPYKINSYLEITDDGSGMTDDEFKNRWMMMRYNRLKRQGDKVEFPPERQGENRIAYGRNGVGRHGLLCFNYEYEVTTSKNSTSFKYQVGSTKTKPFLILKQDEIKYNNPGTKLRVKVERNLPEIDKLSDILSARFLHDPRFVIEVNGKALKKEKYAGKISEKNIRINKDVSLKAMFFDSTKTAHNSAYQGIAFWVGKRLVGKPSWRLGENIVIDGRLHFAKTYTFIIKTKGLNNYVKPDWSGFKETPILDEIEADILNKVYDKVGKFVNDCLSQVAKKNITEIKGEVKKVHSANLKQLSALGRYEVDEFIEDISIKHPTMRPEHVTTAVEAVINIEKSRSGVALLEKLSKITEDDVEGLNKLLENWTVKDALCVLDEIDRRLSVIEAIHRFSGDKKTDELHTLHPLVTQARWLFGPEFDSPEYTSNNQLQTIAKKIFKIDNASFENPAKRPDLFVLSEASMSLTATSRYNGETKQMEDKSILLIELKRGGAGITRENQNQASGYISDFINCSELSHRPHIYGFVVGETIKDNVIRTHKLDEKASLYVTTFSQLVDTAKRRLFSLREKLEGYDKMSDEKLKEKVQPDIFK